MQERTPSEYQNFGYKSGHAFWQAWPGSQLFAKVLSKGSTSQERVMPHFCFTNLWSRENQVETGKNTLCQAFRECVIKNEFSYFSTKTYVAGTHWDGSFEHPKQMLKLLDKKIFTTLRWNFLPIWTYAVWSLLIWMCWPFFFFNTLRPSQ